MDAEGVPAIMNLTMVPYGNAQINARGEVTCQHGEDECKGNRWEQCAIAHYPDPVDHFPFYYCMEEKGDSMLDGVEDCAKEASMDYDTLSTCFNGDESTALQAAAAAATPDDHSYVPWVEINGKEAQTEAFLYQVCNAYTGTAPAGCAKVLESEGDSRCFV